MKHLSVGVALLFAATGCASNSTADDKDTAPTSSESTQTATPTETRTPKDPVLTPRPGEVIELDRHGSEYVFTKAGRYAVRLTRKLVHEVDVPEMWEVLRGEIFSSSEFSGGNGVFVVINASAGSARLPAHPCEDQAPVSVGPTARDLADALWAQPALQVTTPVAVTIGGRRGVHVRITLPEHVDPNACVGGQLALFSATSRPLDWTMLYGGAEMWILDVDDERWVIVANCDATCSPADHTTLNRMAESVTFIRND